MKIAIWHNLPSGGGKRTLYSHIQILKEKGHYLKAWTTDCSSMDYLPLSNLITEIRKPIKSEFDKLNRIKNPIQKEKAILKLINDHCKECVKEIESEKFEMIFANSCCITSMPFIGNFSKLPKIVYLGEPNRFLYEAIPENIWQAHNYKFKNFRKILKDFLVNYSRRIRVQNEINAAKSYNKILVNSLFSRENLIRSYGIDSNVCYLGIETEKFNSEETVKEPFVVGLGSITFLKSVHKAIEIIGKIPKTERPELKWVANFMDKYYLDELINLANKLEVEFKVFVNISDDELTTILSRAAIMIYTSRLEPFGLAPLEANACGTYVAAIAEGGVRESIINGLNGTLINGYKINEIADVVKLFVKDLNLARIKGDAARKFVREKWNKQFMANNILSEFEDILNFSKSN